MPEKAGRWFSRSGLIRAPSCLLQSQRKIQQWRRRSHTFISFEIPLWSFFYQSLSLLQGRAWKSCKTSPLVEKKKPSSDSVERMNEVISLAPTTPSTFIPNIHRNIFPQLRDWNFTLPWRCLVLEARISKVSRQQTRLWNRRGWLLQESMRLTVLCGSFSREQNV